MTLRSGGDPHRDNRQDHALRKADALRLDVRDAESLTRHPSTGWLDGRPGHPLTVLEYHHAMATRVVSLALPERVAIPIVEEDCSGNCGSCAGDRVICGRTGGASKAASPWSASICSSATSRRPASMRARPSVRRAVSPKTCPPAPGSVKRCWRKRRCSVPKAMALQPPRPCRARSRNCKKPAAKKRPARAKRAHCWSRSGADKQLSRTAYKFGSSLVAEWRFDARSAAPGFVLFISGVGKAGRIAF